jgi:hypothetical protein
VRDVERRVPTDRQLEVRRLRRDDRGSPVGGERLLRRDVGPVRPPGPGATGRAEDQDGEDGSDDDARGSADGGAPGRSVRDVRPRVRSG